MKKLFLCIVLSVIVLASCSVRSANPTSTVSNLPFPDMKVTESVLTSSDSLLLGETYDRLKIETKREYFSETLAVVPILPTDELNKALHNKICEFLENIDYPFQPECLDFYCEEAFSTRSFTFYVSDTYKLFNEAYFYFSYNLDTNKISLPADFLDDETIDFYVGNSENVTEMKVVEAGVFLRTDDAECFVDSDKFRFDKYFSVFHPESYNPVTKDDKKYVALTFDDGPNPHTTSGLVDMLEEKGVKATFFMVGYNIAEYKSTVKKIYDHGHDIGIHSYGHTDYSRMKGDEVIADIDRCADLVYNITGRYPYLVRPPFGSIDMKKIDTDKYFFVNWNVDPLDWKTDSSEIIAKEAINHVTSGSIILLHDIYQSSCDAAELIIDDLLNKGYRFVTISEYYDLNGKKTDNKLHYYSGDYNE